MDTKLKKSNGRGAFALYFLGVSLLIISLCSLPLLLGSEFYKEDYTQTRRFGNMLSATLEDAHHLVTYNPQFEDQLEGYWDSYYHNYASEYGYYPELSDSEKQLLEEKFKAEWEKTKFNDLIPQKEAFYQDRDVRQVYFVNHNTESDLPREFTNTEYATAEEFLGYIQNHREEYHYLLRLEDGRFSGFGPEGEFSYENFYAGAEEELSYFLPEEYFDGMTCIIAIKENLGAFGSYGNQAYRVYLGHQMGRYLFIISLCLLGVGLILLILSFILRRRRLLFSERLARGLSRIWLEVKIVVFVLSIALGISAFALSFENPPLLLAVPLCYWPVYLACLDFKYNGMEVFRKNSVNSLFSRVDRYAMKYPFQKRQAKKMTAFFFTEAGLGALIILFLILGSHGEGFSLLMAFLLIGVALLIAYRYIDSYRRSLQTLERIMDNVHEIRLGHKPAPLTLYPNDPLYPFTEDLNGINEGIYKMVEERTKSERMKIELITNVSHDLKTPLTSIINYVDLLQKEDLSPDFCKDYVQVLQRKSMRLKTLIEDLFEVSKANSGNMELEMALIDFGELVEQTVAELDEKISPSGLDFRVTIPQKRVHISADGRRLNRVLSNLILNAVKYSLPGTRVYIDVFQWEEKAFFVIKNIASYEMNFSPSEITDRFVRGDAARSTEGSGLGLSIAKSYTELQGGEMDIAVDGDLFKVTLEFPAAEAPQESHQFPDEPPDQLQGF